MGDWHDFFVTAAQAAAALAGLVFVGVSINFEMIMANPRYGLAGRDPYPPITCRGGVVA